MTQAYIIEVNDTAVGLVSRDHSFYRFHAVVPRVSALNGQVFRSPVHATQAARRLLQGPEKGRSLLSAAVH
jgi:alpha-D-ribose 1-methylphosphonate 5-triphosphate synthase subunit PhnL